MKRPKRKLEFIIYWFVFSLFILVTGLFMLGVLKARRLLGDELKKSDSTTKI